MSGSILVTGANGFLGGACVAALRNAGRAVVAVARQGGPGLTPCDLTDSDHLLRILEETSPSAVVNCAVTPDFSPGVLEKLLPVNVDAPALMARWTA